MDGTRRAKGIQLVELNRWDVVATVVIGLAVIVPAVASGVRRVAELLAGGAVPVTVELTPDEVVQAPLGPGGQLVEGSASSVVVPVAGLPPVSLAGAFAETIVVPLALSGAVVCLALLCWRLVRGRAFTAASTRLVLVGCALVLLIWLVQIAAGTMVTNGARQVLGADTDGYSFVTTFPTAPFLVALALGVVAGAMRIGERVQRDSDGLV